MIWISLNNFYCTFLSDFSYLLVQENIFARKIWYKLRMIMLKMFWEKGSLILAQGQLWVSFGFLEKLEDILLDETFWDSLEKTNLWEQNNCESIFLNWEFPDSAEKADLDKFLPLTATIENKNSRTTPLWLPCWLTGARLIKRLPVLSWIGFLLLQTSKNWFPLFLGTGYFLNILFKFFFK